MLVEKRNRVRSDDADAFVPDPMQAGKRGLTADDAESFAEEFISAATTGEPSYEDARDEIVDEEDGGPFLVEPGNEEAFISTTPGQEAPAPHDVPPRHVAPVRRSVG